jgi:hypothetical protein
MVYEEEQISKKVSIKNFSFVILPLISGGGREGEGEGEGGINGDCEPYH